MPRASLGWGQVPRVSWLISPANEGSWDSVNGQFYLVRAVNNRGIAAFSSYQLTSTTWDAQFRYRIGGGSGADGLVFLFYKNEAPYGQPAAGGALGFTASGGPA